jgi:hypothetical protein
MLDSEHFNDVTVLEFMTEANLSEPKRYLFSVLNEGIYAILIYTYALIYFMIELYNFFFKFNNYKLAIHKNYLEKKKAYSQISYKVVLEIKFTHKSTVN